MLTLLPCIRGHPNGHPPPDTDAGDGEHRVRLHPQAVPPPGPRRLQRGGCRVPGGAAERRGELCAVRRGARGGQAADRAFARAPRLPQCRRLKRTLERDGMSEMRRAWCSAGGPWEEGLQVRLRDDGRRVRGRRGGGGRRRVVVRASLRSGGAGGRCGCMMVASCGGGRPWYCPQQRAAGQTAAAGSNEPCSSSLVPPPAAAVRREHGPRQQQQLRDKDIHRVVLALMPAALWCV